MWAQTFTSAHIFPILFFGLWSVAFAQISFVRHDISTDVGYAYGLHAVDMDKDSKMDILVASNRDGVSWWRNNGDGSFERNDIDNSLLAWFVHGADVDGDGDIDVAAAVPNPAANEIRLWINQGGQSWSAPIIFPVLNPEAVHAADLNGDGIMEILGASWERFPNAPGSDLVYFKDYFGATYTQVVVDSELLGAHCVASGDFDNDGKIDIVGSGAGEINIFLNRGSDSFSSPIRIGDDGATGFSLVDVDGDGDLDVVTQPRNATTVAWHENKSDFNFETHIIGDEMGGWSTHAADLDGDGDIDITAAGETGGVIKAYLNDGFQNFTEVTVVKNFPYARFEYPMDVDNDGDADIVGVSASTNTLAWFESVVPTRPTLQITSPNGGEIWEADSTKNITWNYTGTIAAVKIDLSTDGGSTWQIVAATAPNTRSYSWIVPNTPSTDCRIRITDAADDSPVDISDGVFRILSQNRPPIVDISADEVEVIGACRNRYPIQLTIEQAQDPDGVIAAYDWDFGDGSPHSNRSSSLSHDFKVPGAYTIRLEVTDNDGSIGMDSVRITLTANQPPVAALKAPGDTVFVGTMVNFDASASSDAEGSISSYVWNFGDQTTITSSQPKVTHVFQTAGQVNVRLTVSDSCGKSSTASRDLQVMLLTAVAQEDRDGVPAKFELAQNFPNPISLTGDKLPLTRIAFRLPKAAQARLSVYNISGQRVRTILHRHYGPGHYEAEWDLRDDHGEPVSVGIYFYRLQAEAYSFTKKLVITR